MKIEKLTEDKIRVIVNSNELSIHDDDINIVMSKAIESQELFLKILKQAEKELNFYTDGCQLIIEAFSSLDDIFVFTITKSNTLKNIRENNSSINKKSKKKLTIKKKTLNKITNHAICLFENFDTFCDFCYSLKGFHNINFDKLIKSSSLYFWKNTYYLILKNVNITSTNSYLLYSMLSEFATVISFSKNFESKLLEHGKTIIKNNAIGFGIKFSK